MTTKAPLNKKSPLDEYNKKIEFEPREPTPSETLVHEMISKNDIKMKTDLNDGLIVGLTKGSIFATIFKSKNMQLLVDNISEYRISRNRESRKEFKEMVRSLSTGMEMEDNSLSIKSRLLGKDV